MKCFPPVFWCYFEYKVVLYYLKRERVKKHVKPLEGRQIESAMILQDSDALLFVWTVCLPQWTVAAHLMDVNVALTSQQSASTFAGTESQVLRKGSCGSLHCYSHKSSDRGIAVHAIYLTGIPFLFGCLLWWLAFSAPELLSVFE